MGSLLGKYYAARQSRGQYRSCAVTGSYLFTQDAVSSEDALVKLLKDSLWKVLQRHSALCYGVAEKTANSEAQFIRLRAIEWDDVVEFRYSGVADERDVVLASTIGTAHQHLFKDPYRTPAWKIIVLQHHQVPGASSIRVDIAFVSHHAISDGTSCVAFHKTLYYFLSQGPSSSPGSTWPYIVPISIPPPIAIEDTLQLNPGLRNSQSRPFKSTGAVNHDTSDAWTAAPPSLPSLDDYVSRVLLLRVPSPQLQGVLKVCRRLNITLTGLLHGFILMYLSQTVHEARGFRSITPYSMRRFTGFSEDEIINHVSSIVTHWDESILTSLRSCRDQQSEEGILLRISSRFRDQITEELAQVPVKGAEALVGISEILDFDALCESSMKRKRGSTYEVSNIGSFKFYHGAGEEAGSVKLEKLIFTQCGMVAGPAFGCSVVTVFGGPMVLSLHWQEGIIEEDMLVGLKTFLELKLLSFGQGA
ncbi:hypothetical protein G7Y89_g8010 [Cudoniella acicularis]|uniref:Alcohol acetyltransferase n=1 Tax=Cudoniella acicularis TaxID=354080 RepID=A0A8H4W1F9_9HELO|nr:hypothetical protein G7Y89_g8010 [Cudoniella acicularis]